MGFRDGGVLKTTIVSLSHVNSNVVRNPLRASPHRAFAYVGTFNNRTGTEAMTLRPIGVDEFVMDWKLIDELDISKEIGRLQRRLLDDLR